MKPGKTSTNPKCHLTISWATSCQYECVYVCKISSQYSTQFETGSFSLFQNLELDKASTDEKCHFAISWARSCQYQCSCKSFSKYSTQVKRQGHFHFFRIWRSAKPRPMVNVISQSLGLDVVNINIYTKVYHNIPLSSRGRAIFFFFFFSQK